MSLLDKVYEILAKDSAGKQQTLPQEQSSPAKLLSTSDPNEVYADLDKIRSRIKDAIDDASKVRWAFERNWFRNILYYIGNQWITWDQRGSRWREKRLIRKWVPKPVTNRFASTIDTIVAAVESFQVRPSSWPATMDADDLATSEVADRMIPVIDDEIDRQWVAQQAAKWMGLNADAFLFPYYDKSDESLGQTLIPHYRCTVCQHTDTPQAFESGCPQCGMQATEPATDEQGQPIGEQVPIGRLKCDALSPLQVYINQDVTDPHYEREFTIVKTYPIKLIKRTWPETGQFVQPDRGVKNKTGQYFMESLAHISEDGGYFYGRSYIDRATLYTHVEMPSEDFPDGLAVTMASDDTVLEVGPSPFYDEVKGRKEYFNPLVQIPYERVPGRRYSRTPAYDLVHKQDQLNRLESLIEMAVMKGVYSSWILPTGSSIHNPSGEPGQIVKWTPTGTNGVEPKIVTQSPIPPVLLEWKKEIQQDFEELAGTYDALKGNVPSGVSAGYAIQLLTERSYGRFAPVFSNWEAGWTRLYQILIRLARTYFTEERIRRIRGDSGQWEIEAFKGADLKGAIDIKIEGGAERPRSKLAEQALVQSLTEMGYILSADANQRMTVLEMFGMAHVQGGADEDKRQAAKEWVSFLKWDVTTTPKDPQTGTPQGGPKVKIMVDNHVLHILDHQARAKTDLFDQLDQDKQLIWQMHIKDHMTAMQQLAGPPPPGQKGSGQAPPPKHAAPAGSKANEMGDQTMNTVRQGGQPTMGGGGT